MKRSLMVMTGLLLTATGAHSAPAPVGSNELAVTTTVSCKSVTPTVPTELRARTWYASAAIALKRMACKGLLFILN